MTLQDAITKTLEAAHDESDARSIDFNWSGEGKTWCLSGLTIGGLVWESDDFEAENREQAEQDAADYLVEYNDL